MWNVGIFPNYKKFYIDMCQVIDICNFLTGIIFLHIVQYWHMSGYWQVSVSRDCTMLTYVGY